MNKIKASTKFLKRFFIDSKRDINGFLFFKIICINQNIVIKENIIIELKNNIIKELNFANCA